MGQNITEKKRTTGVAANVETASLQMRARCSSSDASNFPTSASSTSVLSAHSRVVREVKQLWERCTVATTPEKLLLSAERLFECLSSSLEQRGLIYPVEAVHQYVSAAKGWEGGTAATDILRKKSLASEEQELPHHHWNPRSSSKQADNGTQYIRSDARSCDITEKGTTEEKFASWLLAAAKQFLLLLCELLDAEAEELQQAGLSMCMRIVAHTHRIRTSAALFRSATCSESAGGSSTVPSSYAKGAHGRSIVNTGVAARASLASSYSPLSFPLSTYQLLLSRVLQARHFSYSLADNLVRQFLLPHPDLRFYFLLIVRKTLESGMQDVPLMYEKKQYVQERQSLQHLPIQQQQQENGEETEGTKRTSMHKQWYQWPASVGMEAAAQRLYSVLVALPVPQKSTDKKDHASKAHCDAANSSSDAETEHSDSDSVSESDSSTETECSSVYTDVSSDKEGESGARGVESSGSTSESDEDDTGYGQQQRKISGRKRRWKSMQANGETASYAVNSCYMLKINTRRCCDPSEYRRVYERVWLLFLRCTTPVWTAIHIQDKSLLHHLLVSLPRVLLPYMQNPLLLADFFLQAFDYCETSPSSTDVFGSCRVQSAQHITGTCSSSTSSTGCNTCKDSDCTAFQQTLAAHHSKPADSTPFSLLQLYSGLPCGTSPSLSSSVACSEAAAATFALDTSGVSTTFSAEAVLALSGLFYLLTQHRLGDPDALWKTDIPQSMEQPQQRSTGILEEDTGICKSLESDEAAAESDTDSDSNGAVDSSVCGGNTDRQGGALRRAGVTDVAETLQTRSASAVSELRTMRNCAEDVKRADNSIGAAAFSVAAATSTCDSADAAEIQRSASCSHSPRRKKRTTTAGGVHMHFYARLYQLLTPAAFSAVEGKARRRFLRLLSLALRSPLLPTNLITCFLKKCCRVACLINPGGAVYLAGLVFVLLRKHASVCSALLGVPLALAQELVVQGGDPFNYNELSLQQNDDVDNVSSAVQKRSDRHPEKEEEEEERRAARKRVKCSLVEKHTALPSDAPDRSDPKKGEGAACEAKKLIGVEGAAGGLGDLKSGGCTLHSGQGKFPGREKEEVSKEASTDQTVSCAYHRLFAHTRTHELLALVLQCAPGKGEQRICQSPWTAGVTQGSWAVTKCIKHQAQTALWELELLRLHYDPTVRQFVSLFDVAINNIGTAGKRARAAAAMAATLDPDDYYWRLDGGALLLHECRVAAKKSTAAAPPVTNRANLPPPDAMQLAHVAMAW